MLLGLAGLDPAVDLVGENTEEHAEEHGFGLEPRLIEVVFLWVASGVAADGLHEEEELLDEDVACTEGQETRNARVLCKFANHGGRSFFAVTDKL